MLRKLIAKIRQEKEIAHLQFQLRCEKEDHLLNKQRLTNLELRMDSMARTPASILEQIAIIEAQKVAYDSFKNVLTPRQIEDYVISCGKLVKLQFQLMAAEQQGTKDANPS